MPKSELEELDEVIFDTLIDMKGLINDVMPTGTMLQTILRSSFQRLSPQEKLQIVEAMGPEWYIDMATKIERELNKLGDVE